jgi:membrane protein DedA with SNARE-associated domain
MLNELTNHALHALLIYGLPLLFTIVLIASAGVPLPASLLLLTAGAFAAQGHFSLLWVVLLALLAAVAGDHLAYLTGWVAGRRTLAWLGRLLGQTSLRRARRQIHRQGWGAVFLSRWLLLPLGAPCSLVCGSIGYPLPAFFAADLTGEAIYVSVLVLLGYWFGDQIAQIADLLSIVGPVFIAIGGTVWCGWALWRRLRTARHTVAEAPARPTFTARVTDGRWRSS